MLTLHEPGKGIQRLQTDRTHNWFLGTVPGHGEFASHGACRNCTVRAGSRFRGLKLLSSRKPTFRREKPHGHLLVAGACLPRPECASGCQSGHRRIRLPYLGFVKSTRKRREGLPYEAHHSKAQRALDAPASPTGCCPCNPPAEKHNRPLRSCPLESMGWQCSATASPTKTFTATTKHSAACCPAKGHRPLPKRGVARAGGKHNAVSTVLTAKPRDCGATRIIM